MIIPGAAATPPAATRSSYLMAAGEQSIINVLHRIRNITLKETYPEITISLNWYRSADPSLGQAGPEIYRNYLTLPFIFSELWSSSGYRN